MQADLSIFLAFGAGLLSFLSPCTLPLYPAFLSYITGMSVTDLRENKGMMQKRALLHTAFFLLGFALLFISLGYATSLLNDIFIRYQELIQKLGAIVVVLMGLVLLGLLAPGFLVKDRRLSFKKRPAGYLGSTVIGLGFAAGWTPCTGPILAAVFTLCLSHPALAVWYMAAYIAGFAVPFLILAFFIGRLNILKKYTSLVSKAGGVLMVFMGVFLYFGWMTKLSSFLVNNLFGGFKGF